MLDAERCGIMERFEERGGTLDGRPALVCGRLNEFATVVAMDGSGVRVEVSWPALDRIARAARPNVRP